MATLTVYIGTGSEATYSSDPNPPVVVPGDTVVFTLQGRTDKVKVVFENDACPFSQNGLLLDGSSSLTASKSPTVLNTASGRYYFTAAPVIVPPHEHDPEPPGTVGGGLDVNTDPRK